MKIDGPWRFVLCAFLASSHHAMAQGTAFIYQGELVDKGAPANGLYDFSFSLSNAPSGGSQIGTNLTVLNVRVSAGLFAATLDFGAVFGGNPAWLALSVRTNGASSFTALSPLQRLNPSPQAVTAESLAGVALNNFITGPGDTIAGGSNNRASDIDSAIGGGVNNTASGLASAISGGSENNATGPFAAIGGGQGNVIQIGATNSIIAGGSGNQIRTNADASFVGGGQANLISSNSVGSSIAGGLGNSIQFGAPYAFVGGGQNNLIDPTSSAASILGGQNNVAYYSEAAVGGGIGNTSYGTVSGGWGNTGDLIPGGFANVSSYGSLAAGNQAQASDSGDFVWADSQNAPFTATWPYQFLIRAQGNVGVNTASPQQQLSLNGAVNINQNLHPGDLGHNSIATDVAAFTFGYGSGEGVASQVGVSPNYEHDVVLYTDFVNRFMILQNGDVAIGNNTVYYTPYRLFMVGGATNSAYCDGTTWVNSSDRNAKVDFATLNPLDTLEKISSLPITEWKYKRDSAGVSHIGPMAQDFQATFGLGGDDDKHIATVDEEGAALSAIQGLNQNLQTVQQAVKTSESELQTLQQRTHSIAAEMDELEAAVKSLSRQ